MCCSGVGQIVFGVIMVVCLGLTLASMFSGNWREFKSDLGDGHSGIFKFNCKFPGDDASGSGSTSEQCKNWWKQLKTWEKVVSVSMCLALATELLCLAWNIAACMACCCKKYIIHPLTLFATLVAIFLGVAILVYGVNNKDALKGIEENFKTGTEPTTSVGYSFYMAVGALVCAAADIVIAALTVCLAEKCL